MNSSTKCFLAFWEKDDEVKILESDNMYLCKMPLANSVLCTIDDKAMFNSGKYVYAHQGRTYQRDVVTRVEFEIDSKDIFDIFVST